MDELLRLSDKNGLALLEDAAQAHGFRYKGKRAEVWDTHPVLAFILPKTLEHGAMEGRW